MRGAYGTKVTSSSKLELDQHWNLISAKPRRCKSDIWPRSGQQYADAKAPAMGRAIVDSPA